MKQIIQKAVNSLGYRIEKIRQPIDYPYIDMLNLVLQDYMQQEPDIFFVQIGANDGMSIDPITTLVKKYHWRGLLVEPQPHMFKKLVENYQGEEQLTFENSALFNHDGTATFYIVREEEPKLPIWCYQIANLNRDRVVAMLAKGKEDLPDNVETLVEAINVPAVTFKTLLSKHNINKLDLLVIDAIGYDYEIIKMIPFDLIKPSIISFEHTMLSPNDKEECFKYLASFGYSFAQVAVDTIAYLNTQSKQGLYFV